MTINIDNAETPGLLRRLAAIFYDLLLIVALLVLASTLVTIPLDAIWGITFDEKEPNIFFQLYLLLVIVGFFSGFWLRGGQTLGMRAWRVMLVRDDGKPLRFIDTLLRQAAALLSWTALGIGFVWSMIDEERLTWHDRLTGTRLVMIEKRKKS